ncbi:hypothetical protein BGX38DRAFT_449022 [Terfezia claveryi]|nr:hypothetical protein BGX38DRAFT_449022 [Terfezia claveryi]
MKCLKIDVLRTVATASMSLGYSVIHDFWEGISFLAFLLCIFFNFFSRGFYGENLRDSHIPFFIYLFFSFYFRCCLIFLRRCLFYIVSFFGHGRMHVSERACISVVCYSRPPRIDYNILDVKSWKIKKERNERKARCKKYISLCL